MRKVYLIVAVVTALLTSCSSDSESNSKMLVKQINTTSNDGSTHTMKYFYEGTKISYIVTDDTFKTEFMYAQNTDLILLVRTWNGSTLTSITSFSYDVDTLIFDQRYTDFVNDKHEYITYDYNDDNTVTRKRYDGIDPWPSLLSTTSKITLDGEGRFVKVTDWDGTNSIPKSEIIYADYNSPFKNITAFQKILSYIDVKDNFSKYITYNQDGTIDTTADWETQFNLSGYPRQQIQIVTNSNGTIVETSQTEFIY